MTMIWSRDHDSVKMNQQAKQVKSHFVWKLSSNETDKYTVTVTHTRTHARTHTHNSLVWLLNMNHEVAGNTYSIFNDEYKSVISRIRTQE